jgi:hypothetical protein
MTVTFILRPETSADIGAITEVTVAAFETLAISQHTEQFVVAALRAAGALTVSLVAEVWGTGDRPYRIFARGAVGRHVRTGMAWARCRCCRCFSGRAWAGR